MTQFVVITQHLQNKTIVKHINFTKTTCMVPFPGVLPDYCGNLTIENGMFIPENSPIQAGTKGRFRCNSGFKLEGDAEIICSLSRMWHGLLARCQGILL